LTLRQHGSDPAPLLEAAFRRIERECMEGVAVLNPNLHVETLGFTRRGEDWLGVLITPWFMNLVLVPGTGEGWQGVPDGQRIFRHFPSGDFAFLGGHEPEVGEYQSCALLSPMAQFPDQESARAVAQAALEALQAPLPGAAQSPAAVEQGVAADVEKLIDGVPQRPLSKRELLLGRAFRRRESN